MHYSPRVVLIRLEKSKKWNPRVVLIKAEKPAIRYLRSHAKKRKHENLEEISVIPAKKPAKPTVKKPAKKTEAFKRKRNEIEIIGGAAFDLGEIVVAKVAGYTFWPAKIEAINQNAGRKYMLYYFGAHS